GDRIVLKRGMSEIVAAGVIVTRDGKCCGDRDKDWLRDFDGWDLSAYCYVDWHVPPTPVPVTGLTRATIQRMYPQDLISAAQGVLALPAQPTAKPEPRPTQELTDDQILEFLVYEGLRPVAAEELTATFNRIRLLARYYYDHCSWDDVREHETRTFLVAPLLIALGWSEQQIKIELSADNRGRIDMACFAKPYRRINGVPNNGDCVLLLESKGFSFGLDYAHIQGKDYATTFPASGVVVATNGFCYKAFVRSQDGATFNDRPSAYLNLLQPRDKYPLDPENVDGGLELLRYLLPQFWMVRR
ncbi:MAG: hypothetical protein ACREHD_11850, partial [Pirellulales bacterium]